MEAENFTLSRQTEADLTYVPRAPQGRKPASADGEAERAAKRERYAAKRAREEALEALRGESLEKRGELLAQSILTVKELSEILDICNAKNVSRLKIGGIEVRLRRQSNAPEPAKNPVENDILVPRGEPVISLADRELLDEAELAQQLIDDPLGYEQAQIDRHLKQDSEIDARQTARRDEAR